MSFSETIGNRTSRGLRTTLILALAANVSACSTMARHDSTPIIDCGKQKRGESFMRDVCGTANKTLSMGKASLGTPQFLAEKVFDALVAPLKAIGIIEEEPPVPTISSADFNACLHINPGYHETPISKMVIGWEHIRGYGLITQVVQPTVSPTYLAYGISEVQPSTLPVRVKFDENGIPQPDYTSGRDQLADTPQREAMRTMMLHTLATACNIGMPKEPQNDSDHTIAAK